MGLTQAVNLIISLENEIHFINVRPLAGRSAP
ncbi:hypothetical protein KL86DES1_20245 [uncultured Desulfovibrio sp.]|uniref:Uncharacterized protein n=1 Tax=uncultured Desulfovibrio sp. TaxID=167968 RepID=A0A212L3C4_9BACT|nr:hypothetical protein KL86DES1_20245 [uncultured Desulfovibrio sp.]